MTEDLKQRILKDIEATGFPTELRAANIIKGDNWAVDQNSTYLDYEQNKSREIDIIARKVIIKRFEKTHIYLAVNLIIEVKKSSKRPWIIFTIPNKLKPAYRFLGPGFGMINYTNNFSSKHLTALNLMAKFPRNKSISLGTSFYEAFKSAEEPSKIYEAVMAAVKAAFHSQKLESREDLCTSEELIARDNKPFDDLNIQTLEIYIPMVIFEGVLCEAILTNANDVEIKEQQFLPLEISHSANPYNKNHTYYPEIMHFDFLPTFLQQTNEWMESIITLWKK